MANIKSAIDNIRLNKRRNTINVGVKKEFKKIKTSINKNVIKGNITDAKEELKTFSSSIDKAVKKGVIKPNTGSRYKSRMSNLVKKAGQK